MNDNKHAQRLRVIEAYFERRITNHLLYRKYAVN